MRILIPLDGSPLAEQALAPAVILAKHLHPTAALVLASIIRAPAIETGLAGSYAGMSRVTLLDEMVVQATTYLHHTAQLPLLQGVAVNVIVKIGVPTEAIRTIAQREHIDLIIMTSHGRSGIAQTLWGSVAQSVMRTCGVPTLVLHPHSKTLFAPNLAQPVTLLVPLDGTLLAEAILPAAILAATGCGGTLYLVRIVPAPSDVEALHEAADYLERLQRQIEVQGIAVRSSVQQGEPVAIIEQLVHQLDPVLLAMATHGRVGLDQLLHGSMTQTIFHDLGLPLLVVHPVLTPEEATVHALLNAV